MFATIRRSGAASSRASSIRSVSTQIRPALPRTCSRSSSGLSADSSTCRSHTASSFAWMLEGTRRVSSTAGRVDSGHRRRAVRKVASQRISARATGSSRSDCTARPARSGTGRRTAGSEYRKWLACEENVSGWLADAAAGHGSARPRGGGRPPRGRAREAHPRSYASPGSRRASTMPMIAASTAAALRPSASPAALPSITTSTLSPTPAPTASIASSAVPRACLRASAAAPAAASPLRASGSSASRRRCRRLQRSACFMRRRESFRLQPEGCGCRQIGWPHASVR